MNEGAKLAIINIKASSHCHYYLEARPKLQQTLTVFVLVFRVFSLELVDNEHHNEFEQAFTGATNTNTNTNSRWLF